MVAFAQITKHEEGKKKGRWWERYLNTPKESGDR
jgi:hypothetical protein